MLMFHPKHARPSVPDSTIATRNRGAAPWRRRSHAKFRHQRLGILQIAAVRQSRRHRSASQLLSLIALDQTHRVFVAKLLEKLLFHLRNLPGAERRTQLHHAQADSRL
jgi:hypothetical protein